MRVLIIPGYYGFGRRIATPSGAGSGVFFRDQAIALSRSGHDVSLVYVHFDADRGVEVEVSDDEGVKRIIVHARPFPRGNSLYRLLLTVWSVRKHFVESRPEVVHAHTFRALPIALAVSGSLGIPYVVTEHSSGVRKGSLNAAWRTITRLGYRRAGAVMAVSEGLSQAMSLYTDRPVLVVPNMVRELFFRVPLRQREVGDPFIFLSVGYCGATKGWDILLDAFSRLEARVGGRRVLLVLCGTDCPEIHELADEFGLRDRVQFTGKVPPDEVAVWMEACDVHVMPSRVETFGIASIEALACGKPIIMSATDAATTIVQSGDGLIVPTEDAVSLAEAMQIMMDSAGRHPAEQIRESCRERFSGEAVTAQLDAVYRDVVAGQ
ncbi:glycosyltransferase [Granulicoccus sp. GXG6511]|uniref:glycosyltransferase n=1 Tax=Granulicoccus sp. GXG6511 TaxID=3381351 RepID=UPI003D7E7883